MGMTEIQKSLFALQDMTYKDFQGNLLPTVSREKIIGVRAPALRKLAQSLRGSAQAEMFLNALPHEYYEENNLHALLLEKESSFSKALAEVERFLPFVDNWATCDGMNPKAFRQNRELLLPHIEAWLSAGHCYTVRFGIKMLMDHFLEEDFAPVFLERVAQVESQEYYVNMVRAWYFATALAKQYDAVLPYLEERRLDVWTHNKTIQKAAESYRITTEQKAYLKSLKVKG